jgi:hypothetical protein
MFLDQGQPVTVTGTCYRDRVMPFSKFYALDLYRTSLIDFGTLPTNKK